MNPVQSISLLGYCLPQVLPCRLFVFIRGHARKNMLINTSLMQVFQQMTRFLVNSLTLPTQLLLEVGFGPYFNKGFNLIFSQGRLLAGEVRHIPNRLLIVYLLFAGSGCGAWLGSPQVQCKLVCHLQKLEGGHGLAGVVRKHHLTPILQLTWVF